MASALLEFSLSLEIGPWERGGYLAMIHLVEIDSGTPYMSPVADDDLVHLLQVLPARITSLAARALREHPPRIE